MSNSYELYLIAIAAGFVIIFGSYSMGKYVGNIEGSSTCQISHADEQKKVDDKAKTESERIDRATPYTGSRDTRFNWLLDNARSSQ